MAPPQPPMQQAAFRIRSWERTLLTPHDDARNPDLMTHHTDPTAVALVHVLVWGLLPLWAASGLADWWCHRRLRIEHSAGWPESALHLAMLTELGIGVIFAALLQINAGVLAALLLLCLLHEATMVIDLVYAERLRRIPPLEQWVHGVQHAMPWAAWVALAVIHQGQALAILGLGLQPPDWHFAPRLDPLPRSAWLLIPGIGGILASAFIEEFARAIRAARPVPRPAP